MSLAEQFAEQLASADTQIAEFKAADQEYDTVAASLADAKQQVTGLESELAAAATSKSKELTDAVAALNALKASIDALVSDLQEQ